MNTRSPAANGPNPGPRTSARIKAGRLAAKQISSKIRDPPLSKKATKAKQATTAKQATKSKQPTQSKQPTKSKQPTQSKQATQLKKATESKKVKGQRQPRIQGGQTLSSLALKEHTRETILEPLPEDLRQWREGSIPHPISEDIPSIPSSKMSTYDKNLPELMTRRNIFDEFRSDPLAAEFLPDPAKPKNLSKIQQALLAGSPSSTDTPQPSGQEISDYSTHCKILTSVNISEADIASRAFTPFFDIPVDLPGGHVRASGQKWLDVPKPTITPYVPRPDYCEGLDSLWLPEWVEKSLGNYARPIAGLAFPNFMVEHKAEGSMKIAHTQCRLDGAFASQSYYELHGLYGDPEVVFDTALVGTVEFNGETFAGNIHWVSKPSGDTEDLEYHMRRVVCFFTRGISAEDFIKARRIARNFRAYFAELRAEHFTKLEKLKPRSHPPNYASRKVADLINELANRNLSTSKTTKAQYIQRLEKDDADRNAQVLEDIIDAASQSHMNSQGSNPALSIVDAGPSHPTQSSQAQKRSAEDMMESDPIRSKLGQKRLRGNGS